MIEIRRILCPTDFSELSERALDYGLELAKWYRAELCLLHVVPRVFLHPELYPYVAEPVLPDPKLKEQALRELGSVVHRAREAGVTAEVRLEEGDAVEEILRVAEELPADLVVMGTHGRRGFERLVLGSVAEKVVRKASAPVLTVSQAPPPSKTPLFKSILVPVDFSAPSLRAFDYAVSFAHEADAKLLLVHVVESLLPAAGAPEDDAIARAREALHRDAERRLGELLSQEERPWLDVEVVVVAGRAHRKILELARDRAADLVVMGVSGRGALDRAVFGSVTSHVVREAPCPVLTVRGGP